MTAEVLLIAFILLLAGTVKGVFGVGLPAVSMGLLALMMPPVQAAALIVVPTLLTNIWQFASGPNVARMSVRFATMMLAIAVGTAMGIAFLTSSSPFVPLALGGVLMAYACVGLFLAPMRLPSRFENRLSPVIGLLTGIINGATSVAAVPLVPYLNSLGLSRDELIQAMGLMFTVCIAALSACLVWTGHLQFQSLGMSTLALAPGFVGLSLGRLIRIKLHADVFRKWFLIGLLALGGYMVLRVTLEM